MVIDPNVVVLIVAGSSTFPHISCVSFILQGSTIECLSGRTLADARAYLASNGYACFLPACESRNTMQFPGEERKNQTVTIEFWRKPDADLTVKKPG